MKEEWQCCRPFRCTPHRGQQETHGDCAQLITISAVSQAQNGNGSREVIEYAQFEQPGRPRHRSASIRSMVLLAMFTAIIILMAFTPIGYIDLPIIKATLIHVPVIVGVALMGPKRARS